MHTGTLRGKAAGNSSRKWQPRIGKRLTGATTLRATSAHVHTGCTQVTVHNRWPLWCAVSIFSRRIKLASTVRKEKALARWPFRRLTTRKKWPTQEVANSEGVENSKGENSTKWNSANLNWTHAQLGRLPTANWQRMAVCDFQS